MNLRECSSGNFHGFKPISPFPREEKTKILSLGQVGNHCKFALTAMQASKQESTGSRVRGCCVAMIISIALAVAVAVAVAAVAVATAEPTTPTQFRPTSTVATVVGSCCFNAKAKFFQDQDQAKKCGGGNKVRVEVDPTRMSRPEQDSFDKRNEPLLALFKNNIHVQQIPINWWKVTSIRIRTQDNFQMKLPCYLLELLL